MNRGFYPRLAWTGMKQNRRLYLPYLLTCTGVTAMFYILMGLSVSTLLPQMSGGRSTALIMSLGSVVIAFFALIFLFYTHSFLIRRRSREFGLYNVLGMGKGNIARILLWETLLTYAGTTVVGLALGVALSKLAELGLMNLLRSQISYTFTVNIKSLLVTLVLFAAVHGLIFLHALWQLHRVSAVALLHSESVGEKPPRARWLLAVLALALLGGAYWLAVSIREPLEALLWFFTAVLMVIAGTYLLFISGSVALCRALQKNPRYYYRPSHFVSVSSMAYRMKRNGAGLASVCVLATMVLVMLSSTTCLYFGQEDAVNARYPHDIAVTVYGDEHLMDKMELEELRQGVESAVFNFGGEASNVAEYREVSLSGLLDGGNLIVDAAGAYAMDSTHVIQVHFVPLEEYNAVTGQSLTLEDGQVYVAALRMDFNADTLSVDGGMTRHVMKREITPLDGAAVADITPSLTVVVKDFERFVPELQGYLSDKYGWYPSAYWNYGFDTDLPENQQANTDDVTPNLTDALNAHLSRVSSDWGVGVSVESKAGNRADFYGTYGGLFFLGIMLSVVFLLAAVSIIYYKQICEGYEDRRRYEIMQSVGMTKQEIRKSINSQLLTVFFLPLLFAGLHLGFAFPFIHKILLMFNFNNLGLLIGVTALSFVLFALLYTVVYRMTGNAYYKIVSEKDDRN